MAVNSYGSHKYGTPPKYGPSVVTETVTKVLFDWSKTNNYVDETTNLVSFQIKRGRKHYLSSSGSGFESDETGKLTVVLENIDDRFTAINEASPLYPNVQSGRQVTILTYTAGGNFRRFTGIIQSVRTYGDSSGRKFARIECADGWHVLRNSKRSISIALQENVYADDIISAVLTAAAWPYARALDSGVDLIPFWWTESPSASKLISDITQAELGLAWVAADGTFVFHNRFHSEDVFASLTGDNIDIDSLSDSNPLDNIRNLTRVTAAPIYKTSEVTLWELAGATILLQAAGEDATVEIFGEFSYNLSPVAATECVTPVQVTDYEVYTTESGPGTDLTSQVVITAYFFSSGFKLLIHNQSGQAGYVRTLRVRGKALATGSTIAFTEQDLASVYDLAEFHLSSKWIQNPNAARQMAKSLLSRLKSPRSDYTFGVVGVSDYVLFALDLGQRLSIASTEAGINGAYRVIYIDSSYDADSGRPDVVKITVEPLPGTSGSGSTLPVTLPFTLGSS